MEDNQIERNKGGRPKGKFLTPKMLAFIDAYMRTLNMTQAYLDAGYKASSRGVASREAVKLMKNQLIVEAIEARKIERKEDTELTVAYVVEKLLNIVKNTEDDNPQAALRALELAGRHLGMYRDKQEISGPDGNAIQVQEQKVQENVSDFTRKLSRLALAGGTDTTAVGTGTRGKSET